MESASSDQVEFRPIVELDSGSPEFIRGCEVGRLQARIELLGDLTLREMVRRDNQEMLRRMAEAAGRPYRTEAIDSKWIVATIAPAPSGEGSPTNSID